MFEPLTQRLERLLDDERGVSPVVGFVLIFALIILVFTIYQADVVPAQNKEVEFKHSQEVEGDMSRLNDAIQQASASGVPQSVTIDTGAQYPDRALAINPGPPIGTLQAETNQTFPVGGVNVDGSAYWDGKKSSNNFSTKSLTYTVNYNQLQQDPSFTIDQGLLTKSYGNGRSLPVGDESDPFISNRQINLYLIGGDYQESAATAGPTAKPISTSTKHLQFESSGQSEFPVARGLTKAECEDRWERIYGPGFSNAEGSHPNSFVKCKGNGEHVMKLKPNKDFTIRITKVGFGDISGLSTSPKEVVPTEETTGSNTPTARLNATVGEERSFTVLVRDEYGNPVSGATVNATPSANLDPAPNTTNDQGKATFGYTPPSSAAGSVQTIEVSSPDASFNATYEFDVSSSSSEDSSSDTDDSSEGGDRIVYAESDSLMSFSTKTGSVKDHSPQSVDVIGSATKLLDGSHSIPFYGDSSEANSALQYIDDSGDITELPTGSTTVKSQKSVVATANWNGNPTSVYYATNNDEDIYRIDPNKSSPDKVASPGDGVNGVLGTGDIDSDGTEELVYVDGSQAIRYLDPDPGDSSEEELGGAGSNNNVGAGEPASFWGYGVQVPIIDGSNNVALMAGDGSKTTLTNNSPAEKTLVTPTDVDGDGRLEVVFVHTDGYLAYVDDISGDRTVKAVTDDSGNQITGVDTEQGVQ